MQGVSDFQLWTATLGLCIIWVTYLNYRVSIYAIMRSTEQYVVPRQQRERDQ